MRVHHTPLVRQNENLEYCQRDLKKYVPSPDSSRKSATKEQFPVPAFSRSPDFS